MAEIALVGVKPTGTSNLVNCLATIKPALELARSFQPVYFIADYHALTTTIPILKPVQGKQEPLPSLCYP